MTRGKLQKTNSNRSITHAQTKRLITQMLQGTSEHKVYSTQATGVLALVTGTVINISNGIVEGDDVSNRSGTKITVIGMNYKFHAETPPLTVDQTVRFILFRDLQNNGTTPTVTEVLPTTGYLSHYSDVRYHQQHRFQILHDQYMDLSLAGPSLKTMKFKKKVKFPVHYNGATGVASANGRGALFLLVIGSDPSALYDYDIQLVYTDH